MKMLKPEMDIVRFGAEDVIATSGDGPLTHAIFFNSSQVEYSDLSALSAENLQNVTMISDGDNHAGHLWLDTTSAAVWRKAEGQSGTYSFGYSVPAYDMENFRSGQGFNGTETGWYYTDTGTSWTACSGSN